MINLGEEVKEWCNQFTICNGCKFQGGSCVAPSSDSNFDKWILKMSERIINEHNTAK
jgi:hypothetical protein